MGTGGETLRRPSPRAATMDHLNRQRRAARERAARVPHGRSRPRRVRVRAAAAPVAGLTQALAIRDDVGPAPAVREDAPIPDRLRTERPGAPARMAAHRASAFTAPTRAPVRHPLDGVRKGHLRLPARSAHRPRTADRGPVRSPLAAKGLEPPGLEAKVSAAARGSSARKRPPPYLNTRRVYKRKTRVPQVNAQKIRSELPGESR